MSGAINKVKDALHLNKDHSTTHTTGTTGTHTTGTHTAGTTGHSTVGHSGTSEGVAGPHGSRVANAADPRVDSDLDNSRTAGASHANTSHTTGGYTGTGTGVIGNNHSSSTTAGPHSSNVANKLDPRVDSDRDGSRNLGAASGTTGTHTGTTGSGLTGTHGTTGTHSGSGLTGSHGTTGGLGGTHAGNTTGTHTGTTGGLSHSTNAGPHNSNALNKADPRVDSDLDGRGNRHGASTGGILGASGSHATPGSGTAQNTAGPHNSDMLNKVDPRVDSDRDGSKTYGGNKTHA